MRPLNLVKWLFCYAAVFCFLPGFALAQKAKDYGDNLAQLEPVKIVAVTITPPRNEATITAGQTVELIVKLHIEPGFHAYLEQYKLELKNHPTYHLSEIQVRPLQKFFDPISKKAKTGTKDYAEVVAMVDIPAHATAGVRHLNLSLTYQACGEDFCLFPKKIDFTQDLAVERTTTGEGLLSKAIDKGWGFTLVLVFLAGVLTSLTPCIFPMIPITLAILGSSNQRSRWQGFSISITYVLGIAITYSILGIFAAKTGSLFGSFLGHPIVVMLIAFTFLLMGLSMYGLFEIHAPSFISKRFAKAKANNGFIGAFLSGLVAGVVASPCVGPVLVGILTYVAQTQNVLIGFILLFTFAFGLGQLFILLGTFQSLLHRLPRSGQWMVKIKYVFGTIMILMAFYFVFPIARPTLERIIPAFEQSASLNKAHGPEWYNYSDELLATALKEGKPVIIDFQAEWCLACKELEMYTFSDPQVLNLGKDFVWMTFDATSSSEKLLELQKRYRISGLPHVVIYNKNGVQMVELTLTGFEDAPAFLQRMKAAAE